MPVSLTKRATKGTALTFTEMDANLDALNSGKADTVHTHPSSAITDFVEATQDVIGAMIAAAGGSYNDAANTITLPTPAGGTAIAMWVSVKSVTPAAVGNGVANDTAAFAAACAAVNTANGGYIFVPNGSYLVDPGTISLKSRTGLIGEGGASRIFMRGAGAANAWLIDISGVDQDNRTEQVVVRDVHLEGGDAAQGRAIRSYYAGLVLIENVSCWYWPDGFLYAVCLWDSRIRDCQLDWPCWNSGWAMHFLNSDAASGFGFSSYNTNQIHVSGVRMETMVHGGIRIECGTNNTNTPNTMYFEGIKLESYSWTNKGAIWLGAQCRNMSFRDIYMAFGNWSTGTTALDAITVGATTGGIVFDTINVYQETAGMLATVFKCTGATGVDRYRNILYSGLNNSPATAIVQVVSGVMPVVENIEAFGVTGAKFTSGLTSYVLTDAATIAVPLNTGHKSLRVLLTSAVGATRVLGAPTGLIAGTEGSIYIRQSATGSNAMTYNSAWKFSGGAPTLSTAANALDRLDWKYDGTTLTGTLTKNYA